MKPLAIDLFCGLGGWTDGLLAEGYDVIGIGVARGEHSPGRDPVVLVVGVLSGDGRCGGGKEKAAGPSDPPQAPHARH